MYVSPGVIVSPSLPPIPSKAVDKVRAGLFVNLFPDETGSSSASELNVIQLLTTAYKTRNGTIKNHCSDTSPSYSNNNTVDA